MEWCFESIKSLTLEALVLKPINPDRNEPIWLVTDGSKCGVRVYYGQGKSWQTYRTAKLMSKKFTPAQHNYRMHEHKLIAVLEALMK